MYKAFFGFREQPFNVTPDPRFLFLSRTHQEALTQVLYGVRQRLGFLRVTGEVGTGKTILCRRLLDELSGEAATAYLFNPFLSRLELLRTINEDFGVPCSPADAEKKLIDDLNGFLLEQQREGRNAVLILDEAQNLSELLLEQVRLLSNLETDREKLLQIILVGQPELETKLRDPRLRQLDERIAVKAALRPLTLEETAGYVSHRLALAGGGGDVRFEGGALERVFEITGGIPRRINLLCDRSLLLGLTKGRGTIDAPMVEAAAGDLGWQRPLRRPVRKLSDFRLPVSRLAQGAVILVLLSGAALLGREFAGRGAVMQAVSGVVGKTAAPEVALGSARRPAVIAVDSEREWRLQRLWAIRNQLRLAGLQEDPGPSITDLADRYRLKTMTVTVQDPPPRSIARPLLMQGWTEGKDQPELWVVARASQTALEIYNGRTRELRREEPRLVPGRPVILFLFYEPPKGEDRILALGNSGPETAQLQRQLSALGDYSGPINGVYDESTRGAVKLLQKRYGLRMDGMAGPRTRTLLTYLVGADAKSRG